MANKQFGYVFLANPLRASCLKGPPASLREAKQPRALGSDCFVGQSVWKKAQLGDPGVLLGALW